MNNRKSTMTSRCGNACREQILHIDQNEADLRQLLAVIAQYEEIVDSSIEASAEEALTLELWERYCRRRVRKVLQRH